MNRTINPIPLSSTQDHGGFYVDSLPSTGDLPFGLTPEMLAKPHASRPWNPLIAQTFYRRGIIEIWGRGTNKIIELTEQAGLPTPEFESYTGEFLIRFRPGKAALKARQV